jgi:hypothetical protein
MKTSFDIKGIFDKYRMRKISSQQFLDSVRNEKHGPYYIYSFIQLRDTTIQERTEALNILLNADATGQLHDFIINCNPTPDERDIAFRVMFKDYYDIARFIRQDHATHNEIKYTIENLQNEQDLRYRDVVTSLSRYFNVNKDYDKRKEIIPSFVLNPLLLFTLIEKNVFMDHERDILYKTCSKTLFSFVKRSVRLYTYTVYFRDWLNYEEKFTLVQRVMRKQDIDKCNEILRQKIEYKLESDLEDQLNSLVIMGKISGINSN